MLALAIYIYSSLPTFDEFIAFFKYLSAVFSFRFVTGSEEHEVFLPEYFQSTILNAAHFRRVVN